MVADCGCGGWPAGLVVQANGLNHPWRTRAVGGVGTSGRNFCLPAKTRLTGFGQVLTAIQSGSGAIAPGSGRTRPFDLRLAILGKAISEVEIDQALVRHAHFGGHAFEVLNYVLGEPHGHRLLEL